MIFIGGIFSGPELDGSSTEQTIKLVGRIAADLRGSFNVGDAPAVNVVFCVPGSLRSPDWDWLQEGTFSRRQKLLLVQVAVPAELVNSPQLDEFIIRSLHGANTIAFHTFNEKDMKFPLREAEELVLQVKDRLADLQDPQTLGHE